LAAVAAVAGLEQQAVVVAVGKGITVVRVVREHRVSMVAQEQMLALAQMVVAEEVSGVTA
jgi:Ethanolamine utilization protein EutJ (predicted chaperonin)